ncbi:MAG: HEAT repeat domain-containing protein [Planctomycetota bacterium]
MPLPLMPCLAIGVAAGLVAGCQSGPVAAVFARAEKTSYRTPAVRAEEAEAIADKATGQDTPEQQALLGDLVRRLQTEQDPLVRERLITSIAAFPMPLAQQALQAGLADTDEGVRRRCCAMLGERGSPEAVTPLARVAAEDDDFDVRVAATLALGGIRSPESVKALVAALEDSNPALQYAGVEAMRDASGQDFGRDVRAYLAYARGESPEAILAAQPKDNRSVLGRLSPF